MLPVQVSWPTGFRKRITCPTITAQWGMGVPGLRADFASRPYGAFWADMVYASRRTNTSAFTLWVFSAQDQGESTFVIDARRSRFGT